ncbi:contact-dependent growth inhibition system immunity protein [Brenneria goodwinii]|uniref:contact-dependent growth inhibition system immunity protein n=1 Tax=Brenneria goodwinii TaxID=1109412 RepID=UPI0036E45E3D
MTYQYLDHLMGAYLNQDYDLSGETIEEVVGCYLNNESPEHAQGLINDCAKFIENNRNVETEFEELYGADFSPRLWGVTAADFLSSTVQQAQNHLNAE